MLVDRAAFADAFRRTVGGIERAEAVGARVRPGRLTGLVAEAAGTLRRLGARRPGVAATDAAASAADDADRAIRVHVARLGGRGGARVAEARLARGVRARAVRRELRRAGRRRLEADAQHADALVRRGLAIDAERSEEVARAADVAGQAVADAVLAGAAFDTVARRRVVQTDGTGLLDGLAVVHRGAQLQLHGAFAGMRPAVGDVGGPRDRPGQTADHADRHRTGRDRERGSEETRARLTAAAARRLRIADGE